jgi:signal transduction histidine kinase
MRLTIRVRLTLLYSGLFVLAGIVLLAVTYVLMNQRLAPAAKVKGKLDPVDQVFQRAEGQPGEVPSDQRVRIIQTVRDEVAQDTLNSMLTQGGIALALVSAVAAGLGWLMADRALRPVHQVTETARRVSLSHNLTERIGYEGPRDDIKELADTFDTMLARLARAFDGQRRFVANASHELRTPLAINRTLIDVAVRHRDACADLKRLGESLLVVNARHERLIDGLLTLAGSENTVPDRAPLDLADVAGHVLDQAQAGARERNLTVHRSLASAPTAGDPILLERLLQNLVENAVRYNVADGGEIWVGTRRPPHAVELLVANTGPAVPPYDIETIFEPFRRLRGDRVESERGAGLGLSIVRAIATAHGGIVRAEPRAGGGLTVVVRLPDDQRPGLETAGAGRQLPWANDELTCSS